MTPIQVQKKLESIKSRQKKLSDEIDALRKVCSHPKVICKPKSNTGNWCPQDNHYWTEYNCPDCSGYWRFDGSHNVKDFFTRLMVAV